MPDKKEMDELPPFLRDHPDRPRPLSPTAEKCFERSLELPCQLDPARITTEFREGMLLVRIETEEGPP